MNNIQLLNVIKLDFKLSQSVKGVYASNELPNFVFKYPSAYIINTQPVYMRGEHWVCAWFDKDRHVDFFDSFGRDPFTFDNQIYLFLQNNCSFIRYNNKDLQGHDTNVCGYYVLFYLLLKSRGYAMNDVTSIFGNNKQINDYYVIDFVNSNIEV